MPNSPQTEHQRVSEGERRRDVAHERARLPADFVRDPRMVEAVLEALIASSADAIISWDVKGTILAWSPAATGIFGHRAEDVVGSPITILVPPELHGEEAAFMAALQRGARVENVDTVRLTKDGRRIPVSLTISPAVDASGAVVAATAICRNLTATRAGEAAQATLAAIVQSSDDAIVGKTLQGIIMTWNAGAERVFGYSKEEAVGKPITMLLPPERISEEATILATLIRGERIDHFETERVRKDGRRIQISLSVSPIRDGSGTIIGAAKIARDVTQRRALEEERDRLLGREQEARATAEAANRAKDAFLATVSHELRTPLSPILAWTSMLRQRTLAEGQTEKALATIERNARAQAQLIEDLLDVSRIVSGKMRLEVRPTDLATVIHAAIDVVGPAADAKEIRMEVVLDTQTGPIAGDPARLQQVVWNLLSNAVKFTPKRGRIQIVLERVNSHVEIAVSDTGQGLDPRFLPHIFERFRQADSTTSRMHGGLGLGLAIVRHIVELHGGTVHAESPGPGQGATFTVKLPLVIFTRTAGELERRHPTAGDERPPEPYPRLDGVRVLVVDDEPDSNDVVSTLLGSAGAEVRVAASVAQALDVLSRWLPDLVVCDIGMPGEDGYALVAEMRRRGDELARIPMIALTAYATRDDRVRILAAGFQMHVTKPIDPLEVVTSIANVARSVRKH
jgi:PAS domain S-box-containing protein